VEKVGGKLTHSSDETFRQPFMTHSGVNGLSDVTIDTAYNIGLLSQLSLCLSIGLLSQLPLCLSIGLLAQLPLCLSIGLLAQLPLCHCLSIGLLSRLSIGLLSQLPLQPPIAYRPTITTTTMSSYH
jgi:hypothetical protein